MNGVVKQSSNTCYLINDIPTIIDDLSNGLTFEGGDPIPRARFGFARTPQEFLKPGDVVKVEIEKVGRLRNPVVDIREAQLVGQIACASPFIRGARRASHPPP